MALIERSEQLTVGSALAHRATVDPERLFLIFEETTLTFGQVEARAESLAAAFNSLGITSGDRVAIILPCWPEFVISMFAAAKLGATIVPLNPRLTTPELQYMLRHSEAAAAITVETYKGIDYLQLFEEVLPQLPDLRYIATVGREDLWYDDRFYQFEDLVSSGEGRDYEGGRIDAAEDIFAILYTSGTTGKPKGVELTHRNLLHVAAATSQAIGLGREDRVIGFNALFHVFGIGPGILGTVLAGASMVMQDDFDGRSTLDLIERHGVTIHHGVPTAFVTELFEQRKQPRDLSTLRTGVTAGAPMSDDILRQVAEELCPDMRVAYSLTEAASTVCVTHRDDPEEKQRFTVGRPFEGTEVRVLEKDGTELPPESLGEIALRGPGVMKGYYRQPKETANSFDDDGFFLTGDLGIVDEDGYVHLVGRSKEVIIRGGFNVYPREVEDRIQAHPAVRDVAAVGIPDEILGEAICACIVPVEGAILTGQEVKDWCRLTLADYKVPDRVRFLDEFPLTGTGKVRRVELARLIQAEQLSRRS